MNEIDEICVTREIPRKMKTIISITWASILIMYLRVSRELCKDVLGEHESSLSENYRGANRRYVGVNIILHRDSTECHR